MVASYYNMLSPCNLLRFGRRKWLLTSTLARALRYKKAVQRLLVVTENATAGIVQQMPAEPMVVQCVKLLKLLWNEIEYSGDLQSLSASGFCQDCGLWVFLLSRTCFSNQSTTTIDTVTWWLTR